MQKNKTAEFWYFIILMILFTFYEYEMLGSYSNLVFETTVGAYSGYFYPVMTLMLLLSIFLIIRYSHHLTLLRSNSFPRFYIGYSLYIYIVGLLGSVFFVNAYGIMVTAFRTSFPLLFFIVFYILSFRLKKENKQIIVFIFSFLFLVYGYYINYQNRYIYEVVYVQTITSYFILYMLPLVLCAKYRLLKIFFCAIVAVVVLSSAKKAGTIALIAGVYVFFFVSSLSRKENKNSWWKYLIVLVVMIVAAYGIDYWFTYSDAVIASRMSELGGEGVSGRTEIWVTVLDRIVNSNPLTILFGHGYNAVGLLSNDHLGAHNDFLEVLYDFGFIAFIAYCALYVKLFKKTIKLIKNHSKYAAPLGMSLTIFFIESMSSQIVTAPFFGVMFSMTWAFILAQNDIELHRIR